ncbi:sce7726 family protein [Flavobacterium sp. ACN6]|uniref:sce7726 family protein n=1 Tax=Flavobacterium sp. ACN6 TaxID=1920426 RepID=UPI000BB2F833|nr:sce7726 family protein [Flavobacterium sp. ACN6]PBJ14362.1 hypothetical protein BSF42_07800 [Flavobacterium sp. ACN6]
MKDPCIRELLRTTELKHYIDDNDSKIVEELSLPVAKARIDIAVINGSLHGYEIKSASDTLQRLPAQIEAYTKVFDFLSIVTEEKYGQKILDYVPDWIGVLICNEKNGVKSINELRKPIKNESRESIYIAKLLWREELMECLEELQIKFRKKDRNWLLCEALSSNLDTDSISAIVRNKLKKRETWKESFI